MSSEFNTIQEHLEKAERSVNWLARKTGITRITLGKYLKGETEPTITRLKIIADVLGVPPCDLLKNGKTASKDKE